MSIVENVFRWTKHCNCFAVMFTIRTQHTINNVLAKNNYFTFTFIKKTFKKRIISLIMIFIFKPYYYVNKVNWHFDILQMFSLLWKKLVTIIRLVNHMRSKTEWITVRTSINLHDLNIFLIIKSIEKLL